jgi:hypothetical protein
MNTELKTPREVHLLMQSRYSSRKKRLNSVDIVGIVFCLVGSSLFAQSTGMPRFAAPEPVELGFVDAATGNLHLSIPLGSYPQRGGNQQSIDLEYDSSFWAPHVSGGTVTWNPQNGPGQGLGGWYLSHLADQQAATLQTSGCWQDWTWHDRNGTAHTFHIQSWGIGGCPTSADAFATDSSGYHAYFNYPY